MKQLLEFSILLFSLLGLGSSYAQEATSGCQEWSFSGIADQYDKEQLRHGLQVYGEKCCACHSVERPTFRVSTRSGGLELTVEEARSIAGDHQFPAIRDDSQIGEHDDTLNNNFIPPYLNDREVRYLNNDAEPIDLSYIICICSYDRGFPQFSLGAFLSYTDQGTDYVYALLADYLPADPELKANHYFPGDMINVPKPLASEEI